MRGAYKEKVHYTDVQEIRIYPFWQGPRRRGNATRTPGVRWAPKMSLISLTVVELVGDRLPCIGVRERKRGREQTISPLWVLRLRSRPEQALSLCKRKEGRKEGKSRHTGERGARMTLNPTGAPPGIGVRNSDSERKRSKER